jgi:hypothetical protein
MSAIYTAYDLIDEMLACMDTDAALVALANAATGKTEEGPWREEVRARAREIYHLSERAWAPP